MLMIIWLIESVLLIFSTAICGYQEGSYACLIPSWQLALVHLKLHREGWSSIEGLIFQLKHLLKQAAIMSLSFRCPLLTIAC